jgi:hypothetical protein
LLFFCLAVLHAGGKKEKSAIVQVSGVVRLVGNAPLLELVITAPDAEWYVAKEDELLLRHLQHRVVTVEGSETVVKLKFANGIPAGERRTLKNITIIAIQTDEEQE